MNLKPAILGGKPVFKKIVPIAVPTLPTAEAILPKFTAVLKTGMITNAVNVKKFEAQVAEYLGVKYAVAVSSCTSGLILVLKSLGLKGDVILPSFTFHATAHALIWNGLKPVFVECDQESYTIDCNSVEKAITARTCAIIGVHIFGNPARVEKLEDIARRHNIKLIFDSAHGFGSRYKGDNLGCYGDAESFSLTPTKLISTAEGGIVTTNDRSIAEKLIIGRNYGDSGDYDCAFSGLNARMDEFSAVLGIESLKMLESNVQCRNRLVSLYKSLLGGIAGLSFQRIDGDDRCSYKDFSILVDKNLFGMDRDLLSAALMKENIAVKKYFYPPVHRQKAFKRFSKGKNLKITDKLAFNSLSIPLYSHMEEDTVKNICLAITRIYDFAPKIRALKIKKGVS